MNRKAGADVLRTQIHETIEGLLNAIRERVSKLDKSIALMENRLPAESPVVLHHLLNELRLSGPDVEHAGRAILNFRTP